MDVLTDKVFGKLYADKGYISQSLFGKLFDNGIHIVTGLRSNMKQRLMPLYDRIMLRKRSVHIPADTRSSFPVISVQSRVGIQCRWQS